MSENPNYKQILDGVIEGHRQLIAERYDYERVKTQYSLPMTFTEDKANELRDFFLLHVYPSASQRDELNDAFIHLDEFIKNPNKIFRIMSDSVGILFKYGRHLPKIIKAAIKAFTSFRSASKIEHLLAQEAARQNILPPFTTSQIKQFMTAIPDEILRHHIESITPLYDVLLDRKLVRKILEVVEDLLSRMKKHPDTYDQKEIDGIEVGRILISESVQLFSTFNQEHLKQLFHEITMIEKDAYAVFMSDSDFF